MTPPLLKSVAINSQLGRRSQSRTRELSTPLPYVHRRVPPAWPSIAMTPQGRMPEAAVLPRRLDRVTRPAQALPVRRVPEEALRHRDEVLIARVQCLAQTMRHDMVRQPRLFDSTCCGTVHAKWVLLEESLACLPPPGRVSTCGRTAPCLVLLALQSLARGIMDRAKPTTAHQCPTPRVSTRTWTSSWHVRSPDAIQLRATAGDSGSWGSPADCAYGHCQTKNPRLNLSQVAGSAGM